MMINLKNYELLRLQNNAYTALLLSKWSWFVFWVVRVESTEARRVFFEIQIFVNKK